MQDNPVAQVNGANKGIGLQIAKDLAAHGQDRLCTLVWHSQRMDRRSRKVQSQSNGTRRVSPRR
jgi:NAD(P)-dependent dehydrogenase (short-subunit alcohol dehydrogenase family)